MTTRSAPAVLLSAVSRALERCRPLLGMQEHSALAARIASSGAYRVGADGATLVPGEDVAALAKVRRIDAIFVCSVAQARAASMTPEASASELLRAQGIDPITAFDDEDDGDFPLLPDEAA